MVKVGDLARDAITGFEGVVIGYSRHLYNADRAGLQPRELIEGHPAESKWFDTPQLEVIQEAVVPVIEPGECPIELGEQVKDKLSSYSGTVVAITTFISGCHHLSVQSPEMAKGLPVEDQFFAASRLRKIEAKAVAWEEEKIDLEEVAAQGKKKEKPGGPLAAPKLPRDPKW